MKGTGRYLIAVALFALLIGTLATIGDSPDPRIPYLIGLFAICSSPLLLMRRLNGRYAILCTFMALFFLFYGASDVLALLESGKTTLRTSQWKAEVAVLLGAISAVVGYRLAAGRDEVTQGRTVSDWPWKHVLVLGLLIWALGVFATGYWQLVVLRRAWATVQLGNAEGMVLTGARYLHPMGLALIAYAAVVSRHRSLMLLVIGVLAVEFVAGFISDTKEGAFRGVAILLIAKYLLEGRVPKTWVVTAVAVVMIAVPVFQAYRTVTFARNLDRAEAAQELTKNLKRALDLREYRHGKSVYGSSSFIDRSALKPTMIMVIDRVGDVAEYQHGKTMLLYFTGFIPRIFWPGKPAASTGQLFNEELRVTTRGVYISTTVMGELYWNFGWLGIVPGMLAFGALLGFVNRKCNLAEQRTVTRFLIIVVTLYLVCVRFEANIAMTFIVWTRSMLAIGLLHLCFAKKRRTQPAIGLSASPASWPRPQASAGH